MVDCTAFIQPLNLECLLVNTLSGNMIIFEFIALLFIAALAAYFRMMNSTLLIMYGVFGIIMAYYFPGIYFLTIIIGGLIVFSIISKLFKY